VLWIENLVRKFLFFEVENSANSVLCGCGHILVFRGELTADCFDSEFSINVVFFYFDVGGYIES